MSDKWTLMRLYSVENNLQSTIEVLKQDLLRYGYLIKSNLSFEYQSKVINVDYSLSKMIEPCVILHFDKTSDDSPVDYSNILLELYEIVGEERVSIYGDSDTDLIIDIIVI